MEIITIRILCHQLIHKRLFRSHGLGMGTDYYVVAGILKSSEHLRAESRKQSAGSPCRCHQNGGLFGILLFTVIGSFALCLLAVKALLHAIQIRYACLRKLLCGNASQLLKLTDLILHKLTGKENRIVKIKTEHPVHYRIACGMKHMHIPVHILGALPLVYIKSRRGG